MGITAGQQKDLRALIPASAMLPPINDRDDDAAAAKKEFIQRKSYKTKKFMESDDRRLHVVLLCFIAWVVERLQSELEWLDAACGIMIF